MDFLDHTLEDFRQYLKDTTDSKNTIKNYVSDIRIFLIFLDSRHAPITAETFPNFLSNNTLKEFSDYLAVINPPATLNRRISSVKKFFDYYLEHHPLPASPITLEPTENKVPEPIEPDPTPLTPEVTPTPEITQVLENQAPDAVETAPETHSLLHLLPEEIIDHLPPPPKPIPSTNVSPSDFIAKNKVSIICVLSFVVGFLATLSIYPLLYP